MGENDARGVIDWSQSKVFLVPVSSERILYVYLRHVRVRLIRYRIFCFVCVDSSTVFH